MELFQAIHDASDAHHLDGWVLLMLGHGLLWVVRRIRRIRWTRTGGLEVQLGGKDRPIDPLALRRKP